MSRAWAAAFIACAALLVLVSQIPPSRGFAAPSGWQYGPNQPFLCNNPDAPPNCVSPWKLYSVPNAEIPAIMQASPRRCYGYANNTVICEDGPPLCPTLTTGAKTQLLKCGVEQNAQADRLEGTFWVAVRGQPNQEISVRMSVQSSYPYPGTVVSLSQIPGSRSHMASQAKVQHLRDSYDIQIMQLYFTKLKKWLACSAGCTQTLTVVRGF